jgi:hypothetical protein
MYKMPTPFAQALSTPNVSTGAPILPAMTQTSSDRLRFAMKLRALADAPALATLTGIKVSTVRSNLNGNRQVSKKNAPIYAAKLKTTAEWLLYGKGSAPGTVPAETNHVAAAGPLGIIDELVPTLKVDRSQPIVTPGGATGLAFLSIEGRAIAVELDRDQIDQLRKNLRSLENYLDRHS